ncbi:MAG: hypothetical protein HZY79_08210 [Rhodoblastus sp.]|nr:MAG: hypothetical protein HZY79_08210 [Rhodoblastus sp.]
MKVLPSSGTGVLNKGLTWTGDTLDKIVDSLDSTRTETFGYSATRRLTSAAGKYGAMSWTYDAVGNRASEVSGGTTKTFTTPATSNRLSSVTPGTTTLRTFGYDAAGAITTDAKAGVTWTSTYDAEGRLVQAQSGTFTVGSYVYDAASKLAKRTVSTVTPAVTTHYLYDPDGHVVAETTPAGVTTREYLWLGDMPVAVIDAVNTATPVTYSVHTDHLMRPLKMTNAAGAVAWDVVWKPFGETFSITAAPKLDLGFPGQWTQSENGLAWNWHRHYDPTTGRYTKPDPLRFVDGPSIYAYVGKSSRLCGFGRSGAGPGIRKWAQICYIIICGKRFPIEPPKPPVRELPTTSCPIDKR